MINFYFYWRQSSLLCGKVLVLKWQNGDFQPVDWTFRKNSVTTNANRMLVLDLPDLMREKVRLPGKTEYFLGNMLLFIVRICSELLCYQFQSKQHNDETMLFYLKTWNFLKIKLSWNWVCVWMCIKSHGLRPDIGTFEWARRVNAWWVCIMLGVLCHASLPMSQMQCVKHLKKSLWWWKNDQAWWNWN